MIKISNKLKFMMQLSKTGAIIGRKFHGQGLGFVDLAVMYAISQSPEGKIRRTDLADQVGLTASGVTRLLVLLEKIGVVKREESVHDGRTSYVKLTKSGQTMLEDSIKWIELRCDDFIPDSEIKKLDQASSLLESIFR